MRITLNPRCFSPTPKCVQGLLWIIVMLTGLSGANAYPYAVTYPTPSTDSTGYHSWLAKCQSATTPRACLQYAKQGRAAVASHAQAGTRGQFDFYILKSYGELGQFEDVRRYGKSALRHALAHDSVALTLNIYNLYAGYGYYTQQLLDSAQLLYEAALDYAARSKHRLPDSLYLKGVFPIYPMLIDVYNRKGMAVQHLALLREFEQLTYTTDDRQLIAIAMLSIGSTALHKNNVHDAKRLLLRGYAAMDPPTRPTLLINYCTQLYNTYKETGQLDSAAYFAHEEYRIATEHGYQYDANAAQMRLAEIAIENKRYEAAMA